MMIQKPVQAPSLKPIPQHVVERMESEWKQMRETVPAKAPSKG
jgi:hypothetical protein